MKIKTIQPMRFSSFVLIVMIALLCSCNKQELTGGNETPSLGEQCVVRLGSIILHADDSFDASTSAYSGNDCSYSATLPAPLTRAGQTTLEEGANFRLYAFPRGKTEMEELLNTKSFTIKKGLPTLDPGQVTDDNLYLPYGDLDIYIVGPARASEDREVASRNGVFAKQGDDVIASKTEFTVSRTGSNVITPTPLLHRMAKVQVRLKKPDNAQYNSLSLESATILTQEEESPLYVFDEHGGSFTPTGTGEGKVYLQITEKVAGSDYIATGILFPRKSDRFKVEVIFGATNNVGTSTTYSRQSTQIEHIAFPAGEQTALVAYPVIPNSLLYRPVLIPWNATDEILQSTSPLALYLDGRDAPEEIDGKKSWRDRSGNGRHATMNQEIPYNSLLQCYDFTTGASMKLVLNEYMPDYTLELVAISEPQSGFPISFFNGTMRSLCVHLPDQSDYATIFDSGFSDAGTHANIDRVSFIISPDFGFYKRFHTYHFVKSKKNGRMEIYCDGVLQKSSTGTMEDHGKFIEGVLGNYKAKIRSVRLYNKALEASAIAANYQADLNIYKEPEDASKITTNGLILYFDGKLPPYTTADGNQFWPDRSKNLNHAKMVNINSGTVNKIAHNGTGYEFNNISSTQFSALDLTKSAGTHQTFTFEFVCKGIRKSRRSILLAFTNKVSPGISMRILEEDKGVPQILYDIPYVSGSQTGVSNRFWVENQYTTWQYVSERFRTWTFVRTGTNGFAKVYVDGKLIYTGSVNGTNCPEMTEGRIGALDGLLGDEAFFSGEFKAIRGYSRVLTETEMAANRAYDAKRYGVKFSE